MSEYNKERPLRCFFAFAGYDSQALAFNELKKVHPDFEYEIVGWSEIDPYAIKAHNALFPEAKDLNYGDISKIDWSQVPDFDFFTYSSPCLTEDSLILTAEGYRRMSDVKVGDSVLTKSGEWHDVVKKFDNGLHSTCYLNALGFENIHCTLNHKFYVRHMSRVWVSGIRRYKRTFSEPEFKEAKDIVKNDYFGIPVDTRAELPKWNGVEDNRWGHHKICNKITHLLDNPSFWYLMGRYIGDGWKKVSHAGNGIIISCGGRYRKELEDASVRESSDDMRNMRLVDECRCSSQRRELQQQFEQELNACLSELSYETPQAKECLQYLRKAFKGLGSLQQALYTIEEIWQSVNQEPQTRRRYRIRKLTEREVFRLMAVKDEDIDKIFDAGISASQCYKLAGNSIVVDVLHLGIYENLFFPKKDEYSLF